MPLTVGVCNVLGTGALTERPPPVPRRTGAAGRHVGLLV